MWRIHQGVASLWFSLAACAALASVVATLGEILTAAVFCVTAAVSGVLFGYLALICDKLDR